MIETRESRRKLSFGNDDSPTCTLCNGHHTQFSTPSSWKSEDARRLVFSLKVSANSPVCGACRKEVSSSLADQTYIPRWVKRLKDACSTCSISLCKQNIFVSLKKATSEELNMTLASSGLQCTTTEVPIPTPLCKHHYHLVYNMLQPTQTHCVTCDVSLRYSKTKLCPEPEIIKKYLHDNAGYDGDINEYDKICYACYRAHLVILKQR